MESKKSVIMKKSKLVKLLVIGILLNLLVIMLTSCGTQERCTSNYYHYNMMKFYKNVNYY